MMHERRRVKIAGGGGEREFFFLSRVTIVLSLDLLERLDDGPGKIRERERKKV